MSLIHSLNSIFFLSLKNKSKNQHKAKPTTTKKAQKVRHKLKTASRQTKQKKQKTATAHGVHFALASGQPWVVVEVLCVTPLKTTDFTPPSSCQVKIAPHLEVGLVSHLVPMLRVCLVWTVQVLCLLFQFCVALPCLFWKYCCLGITQHPWLSLSSFFLFPHRSWALRGEVW